MTLRRQLALALSLFSCGAALALALVFYAQSAGQIVSRERTALTRLAADLSSAIDAELEVLDRTSIDLGYSSLLVPDLEQALDSAVIDWGLIQRLGASIAAINGSHPHIEQVNYHGLSGRVLGFGFDNRVSQRQQSGQSWFKQALAAEGRCVIWVHEHVNGGPSTPTADISLVRRILASSGRVLGVIETRQRASKVFRALTVALGAQKAEGLQIRVLSADGSQIWPLGMPTSEQAERAMVSATANLRLTDWQIVVDIPRARLFESLPELLIMVLLVVVILAGLTVAIAFRIADRLTRPLRKLAGIMTQTNWSQLDHVDDHAPDFAAPVEIEELYASYRAQSLRLAESMDLVAAAWRRELEARHQALLAQIDPHFQVNALANIIVLAENGRTDDVAKLARSLSGLMRYVLDERPVVTLGEELEHVEQYLACMKLRFQSSLDCQLDVDPSIAEERVPRLLIQPIVENALKHGTDHDPVWHVRVEGGPEGEGWCVRVTDDGEGFTDDVLKTLERDFQRIRSDGIVVLAGASSEIGLRNAAARWYMLAGEQAVFRCANLPTGGALVEIGSLKRQAIGT